MKILGNISHIANSGKLIVKSDKTPSLGVFVINKDKKRLGRVNDIFGPVKTPYVSVKLFNSINVEEIKENIGEELYISPYKRNKRRNKARKRKGKYSKKS